MTFNKNVCIWLIKNLIFHKKWLCGLFWLSLIARILLKKFQKLVLYIVLSVIRERLRLGFTHWFPMLYVHTYIVHTLRNVLLSRNIGVVLIWWYNDNFWTCNQCAFCWFLNVLLKANTFLCNYINLFLCWCWISN